MENQNKNNGSGVSRLSWQPILGGALILYGMMKDNGWLFILAGVVFLILYLVERKRTVQSDQQSQESETPEFEKPEQPKEPDGETWICSHCGATTRGDICEYCDSPRE